MFHNRSTWVFSLLLLTVSGGCSLRKSAINMVGGVLTSGNSAYETEHDVELIGAALPFGLKLVEGLLEESPSHRGLLLTAARGFVLYSYLTVSHQAEIIEDENLDRARSLRLRARKLYLRGLSYGLRGLEISYPGLSKKLYDDPEGAVAEIHNRKKKQQDVPFLYWSAAALGLGISVSKQDATMLARLPEVDAMLARAIELDESWDGGALHEFSIQLALSKPGSTNDTTLKRHYDRVLELAQHPRAGVFVAYAEAAWLPRQDKPEFKALLERALAVDLNVDPQRRLVNAMAQRRARRLLEKIDDLILDLESIVGAEVLQ